MTLYEKLHRRLAGFIRKFFRIEVHCKGNLPSDGGFIVCPNHISFFDVITIAVSFDRPIRYMAKKELFSIPLLNRLITSLGAFPVDRSGNSVGAIKTTINILKSGEIVGIFIQGHRFTGKKLEDTGNAVKGGAPMVAYRAGVPVVPVYIKTKNNRVLIFRKIDVYIGNPMDTAELELETGGPEEYRRAAQKIFDRIVELKKTSEENCSEVSGG